MGIDFHFALTVKTPPLTFTQNPTDPTSLAPPPQMIARRKKTEKGKKKTTRKTQVEQKRRRKKNTMKWQRSKKS